MAKKDKPFDIPQHPQQGVKQFIKMLSAYDDSGKSTREKYWDWLEMAYCAVAKTTAITQERADDLEDRYMAVVESYRDLHIIRDTYPKLLAMTHYYLGLHDGRTVDFLGSVAGQADVLSPEMGQFFTPAEVSDMMAGVSINEQSVATIIERDGFTTMADHAAGAGVTLLSAANRLRALGYNPVQHLFVHAVDVSSIAYKMGYLQLSFAGIPALFTRGNTLSGELFEQAYTPAYTHFRQQHGLDFFIDSPARPGIFVRHRTAEEAFA